jgi:hypothetical protein
MPKLEYPTENKKQTYIPSNLVRIPNLSSNTLPKAHLQNHEIRKTTMMMTKREKNQKQNRRNRKRRKKEKKEEQKITKEKNSTGQEKNTQKTGPDCTPQSSKKTREQNRKKEETKKHPQLK